MCNIGMFPLFWLRNTLYMLLKIVNQLKFTQNYFGVLYLQIYVPEVVIPIHFLQINLSRNVIKPQSKTFVFISYHVQRSFTVSHDVLIFRYL